MTSWSLFRALIDDAAVFPPGNAPVATALTRHLGHRSGPYAALIGPLLLPASGAQSLVEALTASPQWIGEPVRVGIIARPGTPASAVSAALDVLAPIEHVEVAGVEAGWSEDWRDWPLAPDTDDGRPLVLEIPRGPQRDTALADVRAATREGLPVTAKFRTGPTPTWPWPDEAELATVLRFAATLSIPFKLTGGLHHAVRGSYPVGSSGVAVAGPPEDNHGLLNVLVATQAALEGAGQGEVEALLAVRDAEGLAGLVAAWTVQTVTSVRGAFAAYGCCEVTDPIGELTTLGLLDRQPTPSIERD